jgi:hypothetical protein
MKSPKLSQTAVRKVTRWQAGKTREYDLHYTRPAAAVPVQFTRKYNNNTIETFTPYSNNTTRPPTPAVGCTISLSVRQLITYYHYYYRRAHVRYFMYIIMGTWREKNMSAGAALLLYGSAGYMYIRIYIYRNRCEKNVRRNNDDWFEHIISGRVIKENGKATRTTTTTTRAIVIIIIIIITAQQKRRK